jgi:hypothetical protein
MSTSLGPLVRLEGITINQLPPGAKGTSATSTTAAPLPMTQPASEPAALNLKTFITNIITEAVPFIDGVAPKSGGAPTWKKRGSGKRYASSEGLVYSYERTVPGKALDKIKGMSQYSADRKDETWFCRRSCHRNAAEKATATWEEFVHSFKEHHHETEDAFTAAVIGAREGMTWDTKDIEVEVRGERWIDMSLKVVEMKHKIEPKPLKNRTFPVLQLAVMLANSQEFIVVSIPITDFDKSPHAEYARDKSLVVGAYTSVERIRVLPNTGEIEWIMATASNAKGVLPQWLQNLAVPGKILEDVDFFMKWIPTTRKAKSKPVEAPAAVAAPLSAQALTSVAVDKSLPAAPAQSETMSLETVPPPPISKTAEESPHVIAADPTNKVLPAAPLP